MHICTLLTDGCTLEYLFSIVAIKLYEKGVRDVRQLIDVMKLYSIQKTKTVDQIFEFMEAYS